MKYIVTYLSLLIVVSCAVSPPPEPSDVEPEKRRDVALERIRSLASAGEFVDLRKAGASFISRFPADPHGNEVRLLTAQADVELGFYEEAGALLAPLISGDGPDASKGRAFILTARASKAKGRFGDAAHALLAALATDLEGADRRGARKLLEEVAGLLSREDLDSIIASHRSSPGIEFVLEAALAYARASQDTASARRIAEELRGLHREIPAVEEPFDEGVSVAVTADEGRDREMARYSIGILCPLDGRYAPLGNEFLKGVSVAMKEARRNGIHGAEIVVGDTRGDPLAARAATKRLVAEEGVTALVGCVLSSTTIMAAQVAEHNATVLLSPVATAEGIAGIGGHVFQLGSDVEVEIAALARMACDRLHLGRIAYLAVDDLRSRRIGELFGREVALAGGTICAYVYYREGSTDFQRTVQTLRESAPEALFIASDVEDLVLVLPQLSFYEFGVQLLGLSTWHSSRLMRMAGRDMEGAVFLGRTNERRDEEQFAAAAVLVDEPVEDTNPFVLGGYKGVRMLLAAIEDCASDGDLKGALTRELHQRRHPFLELVSGDGIPFYTVRRGRLEPYSSLSGAK